jgi:hypothetical protein
MAKRVISCGHCGCGFLSYETKCPACRRLTPAGRARMGLGAMFLGMALIVLVLRFYFASRVG